jgi:hypothetical protein
LWVLMNFGSQEFTASIDGMPARRNSITSGSGSVPNMRPRPRQACERQGRRAIPRAAYAMLDRHTNPSYGAFVP